jgi:UPF0755 protein
MRRRPAPPRRGGFWSNATAFASWTVSVIAALLVGAFLLIAATSRPGPGEPGPAKVVIVPHGLGVSTIARRLEDRQVVRSALMFRAASLLYGRGRPLQAGEYAFPAQASLRDVIERMAAGRVLLHPLTVPEGWTSEMVIDAIASAPFLVGAAPAPPPEGSLLPETYSFVHGVERADVLKEMSEAQQALLTRLWAQRSPDTPLKTPQEAVILASIVEKETGLASERPQVAAVFLNRLRRGMRLESDPTIIYGLTKGRPLGRGILLSELNAETPYNTYKIDGLPPTPIANPGRAAIEAVLHPPKSDALYFVADGGGGHVFAVTLQEHRKNVARWRALEKSRARH